MKTLLIKSTCFSKLLILFIYFFYASGITYGQKPDEKKLRLNKLQYENSSGEQGATTFQYNEYGIMYKAKWQLLDGSRSSLNFHTFDENGNMIQKYREFSDGLTSNLLYQYDEKGKLISEKFDKSDGVTGTTNYIYDQTGEQVKADCQGLNGWFFGNLICKYGENGKKVGASIEQKGKNVGTISYTYEEEGNLKKEYWDFSGNWNQTFIYEYKEYKNSFPVFYTSSNVFISNTSKFRLIEEQYDYNKENSGPSYFEYDKKSKLVKKVFERTDGLKTATTFEYSPNGILKQSFRKYSNGLTAKFTCKYNGNRRLVNRTFERSDGVKGKERYEYDGKWNLTKAIYDNFDTWLTGSVSFKHDENGNLVNGHFKGEKFNADISFDTDEHGNVVKIHWEFSFGATQTYWFKYEEL